MDICESAVESSQQHLFCVMVEDDSMTIRDTVKWQVGCVVDFT